MNIADRELYVIGIAEALDCPADGIGVSRSAEVSGIEIIAEVPDMPAGVPSLRHPHIVIELGTPWRRIDPSKAYFDAVKPVRDRIMAEREARRWSACDL